MSENKLAVFLYGKKIGILEKLENKKLFFTYRKDEPEAISLSMPIKEPVYDHRHCKPFFAGLIPEINRARGSLSRNLRSDQSDIFGFLKEMGAECAGAISFHDLSAPLVQNQPSLLQAKVLSQAKLKAFITSIPKRSLVPSGSSLKTILSGESDKSQVCLIEGKIALAPENSLTTHIIKPDLGKNNLIFNEYYCLKIAKRIGLLVIDAVIDKIDAIPYLLLTRYDRRVDAQNDINALHQEDFCQALRISPVRKIEHDGGPGFQDIFHLLNKTVIPAVSRTELVRRVIFNYLIGNYRAHGKHFSLYQPQPGQWKLAPLHGSRCDYGSSASLMAMKIGTQYHSELVQYADWRLFCKEINYTFPIFKRMALELIEKCVQAAASEKEAMHTLKTGNKEVDKIYLFIEKQGEMLSKQLNHRHF